MKPAGSYSLGNELVIGHCRLSTTVDSPALVDSVRTELGRIRESIYPHNAYTLLANDQNQ